MSKIVLGFVTAALWLALSYAAHAEPLCRPACDHGTPISKCVEQAAFEAASGP